MRMMVLGVILACLAAGHAAAHFSAGVKLRTIAVSTTEQGLRIDVRAPAPLAFAGPIAHAVETGQPMDQTFLRTERGASGLSYRLDRGRIAKAEAAFHTMLAQTLVISQGGIARPVRVTAHALRLRPPDATPATAAGMRGAVAAPSSRLDPDFGDGVIDYTLIVETRTPDLDVSIRSGVPPLGLPANVTIENRLIDGRSDPDLVLTRGGQLAEPVHLTGSVVTVLAEYTWQGVLHIVEGLDHVLLVVCLALGVGAVRALIWLVTAFTLGHSVTLALAFFGHVPSAGWFIPAVETAIAASVVIAAGAALLGRIGSPPAAAVIGLLHGLGFAFVLGEILGTGAPNLVLSLAAFNVGIEIGQLGIVAVVLAGTAMIRALSHPTEVYLRRGTLGATAALAAFWTVERGLTLI